MAGFEVDPGALAAAALDLQRARARLTEATGRIRDVGAGDLGSRRVDAALLGFVERWGHGLGLLAGSAGSAAARLTDAARHYATTDVEVARGATPVFPGGRGLPR